MGIVTLGGISQSGRVIFGPSMNKSCEACRRAKKKCGGDGVNPCCRCIAAGKEENCVYVHRKPPVTRGRPPRAVAHVSPSNQETRMTVPGADAWRASPNAQSLKRCHLSASLATGLVGMQENVFLGDFFSCLGVYSLTFGSHMREAMVKIMTTPVAQLHQRDRGRIMPTRTVQSVDVDYSTCMFWCACAVGALARGVAVCSITGYVQLAEAAMRRCSGPMTMDKARAWIMLAHVYGFGGSHESFVECMKRALVILESVRNGEQSSEVVPKGLAELVRAGACVQPPRDKAQEGAGPQPHADVVHPRPMMTDIINEDQVLQHSMHTMQSFQNTFINDVQKKAISSAACGKGEGPREDLFVYSKSSPEEERNPGLQLEQAVGSTEVFEETMTNRMKAFGCEMETLEHIIERSSITSTLFRVALNGRIVFAKIMRKDTKGTLKTLSEIVEGVERHPGVCRFLPGTHLVHQSISVLAAVKHKELYDRATSAYNPMRPAGCAPFPSLEEWNGMEACCANVFCRTTDRLLSRIRVAEDPSPLSRPCNQGESFVTRFDEIDGTSECSGFVSSSGDDLEEDGTPCDNPDPPC